MALYYVRYYGVICTLLCGIRAIYISLPRDTATLCYLTVSFALLFALVFIQFLIKKRNQKICSFDFFGFHV